METIIKLLEDIKNQYLQRHNVETNKELHVNLYGRMQGIGEAIDIIRANMPLTVFEVVEYLKNDKVSIRMLIHKDGSGYFTNTDIGFANIPELSAIVRGK